MSHTNGKPPPEYSDWDRRSRPGLTERLYESVDIRRDATQKLIPNVIAEELDNYGLRSELLPFHISDENVMQTKELIDKQLRDWKGLRWWKFKTKPDCWSKWFQKAKCWQDQNQYKPVGIFWCLIFDELKEYTNRIACKLSQERSKRNELETCLYSKCILEILQHSVQFSRTRKTPLLNVRVLTHSKEFQEKLFKINNGFTLASWKKNAVPKKQMAVLVNKQCLEHAVVVYQASLDSLQQIMANTDLEASNVDDSDNNIQINNISDNNIGYGPCRGPSSDIFRVESQRYSPMSCSDLASLSDEVSIASSSNNNESFELSRLSMVNRQLRAELAAIRARLADRREETLQSWVRIVMEQQYPPTGGMHLNNDNAPFYDDSQHECDIYNDYPPPYPPSLPPPYPPTLPPFQPGFAEYPY